MGNGAFKEFTAGEAFVAKTDDGIWVVGFISEMDDEEYKKYFSSKTKAEEELCWIEREDQLKWERWEERELQYFYD